MIETTMPLFFFCKNQKRGVFFTLYVLTFFLGTVGQTLVSCGTGTTCAAGQYCARAESNICNNCPAGTELTSASVADTTKTKADKCTACGTGKSSTAASTACSICPEGKYAGGITAPASTNYADIRLCSSCAVGKFNVDATDGSPVIEDHDEESDCTNCEAGKSSAASSTSCSVCAAGKYRTAAAVGQVCADCPQGSSLSDAGINTVAHTLASQCETCLVGQYTASAGQASCTLCPVGKFNNNAATAASAHKSCTFCPNGKVVNVEGSEDVSVCQLCSGGKSHDTSKALCVSCGEGTFNPNVSPGTGICNICPGGYFNEYPPLFVKGWALVATDDLRAALHYSCTACGAGKYLASSSDPAAHNDPSKCSLCPEGFSSNIPYTTPHVPDATDFSNRVQCAADGLWYACNDPNCGGVRACTSNAGLGNCACDTAEELNLASNGTGVKAEGTGAPACSICAAGRYAARKIASSPAAGDFPCNICLAGTYIQDDAADATKHFTCSSCVEGKFLTDNGPLDATKHNGPDKCLDCAGGTYGDQEAQGSCIGCIAGKAHSATRQTSVLACVSCAIGRYQNNIGQSTCLECPTGWKQPSATTSAASCAVCVPGKKGIDDRSDCESCGLTFHQNQQGQTTCKYCPAGWTQTQEGQANCNACAYGKVESSDDRLTCTDCLKAQHQDQRGQTSCEACENGKYNANADTGQQYCTQCPIGYKGKSDKLSCDACLATQYQNEKQQTTCKSCPNGYTQVDENQGNCDACPQGQKETGTRLACSDCTQTLFQDETGKDTCKACPSGFIQTGTKQSVCPACVPGKKESGTRLVCDACTPGLYQNLRAQDSCKICSAGLYQAQNDQHFCKSCDTGKYIDDAAQSAAAHNGEGNCKNCPTGKHLNDPEGDHGKYVSVESGKCEYGSFRYIHIQCDSSQNNNINLAEVRAYDETGTLITIVDGSMKNNLNGMGPEKCFDGIMNNMCHTDGGRYCWAKFDLGELRNVKSIKVQNRFDGHKDRILGATISVRAEADSANLWEADFSTSYGDDGGTNAFTFVLPDRAPDVALSYLNSVDECMAAATFLNLPNSENSKNVMEKAWSERRAQYQTQNNGGQGSLRYYYFGNDHSVKATPATSSSSNSPYPKNCFLQGANDLKFNTHALFAADCSSSYKCLCKKRHKFPHDAPADCKLCAPGQYGDQQAATTCKDCASGMYTETTTQIICVNCPKGYWQNQIGISSCQLCDKGKYNDQVGIVEEDDACKICATGKYNTLTARTVETDCTLCGIGRYMDSTKTGSPDSDDCRSCPKGKYENEKGVSGQHADSNSDAAQRAKVNCKRCPTGRYNKQESRSVMATHCLMCDVGRYSTETGLNNSEECKRCMMGKYQNEKGQTLCLNCGAGRYSDQEQTIHPLHTYSGNQKKCKGCPEGRYGDETAATKPEDSIHYPDGPFCKKCLVGTYGDALGLASHDSCKSCGAGQFSVYEELTSNEACEKCQAGTYGTEDGCFKDRGTDNSGKVIFLAFDTPLTSHIDDHPRFCNRSCIGCPMGKYSESVGATSTATCIACPAGLYLDTTGNSVPSQCKPCPAGRYSTATGVVSASNSDATSRCTSCSAGRYNDQTGQNTDAACKPCAQGKWLKKTNDDIFDGDPLVSYPYGDAADDCSNCPSGRFGPTTGLADKDSTRGGADNTYCAACASGRYLETTGSISAATCLPCPHGRYLPYTGANSPSECKDCPVGRYGDALGLQAPTLVLGMCSRMSTTDASVKVSPLELVPSVSSCSATVLCAGAATCIYSTVICTGCPVGMYVDLVGQVSIDNCKNCPVGKYGEEVGAYQQGTPAEVPVFCKLCPIGFYSDVPGIYVVTSCKVCETGRYSNQEGVGAEESACKRCRAGTYSDVLPTLINPVEFAECTRCTPGKFLTTTGNTAASDCINCPGGQYSGDRGVTACKRCPIGFWTEQDGLTKIFSCKACGLGRYSDTTGGSVETAACKRCPLGTYSKTVPTYANPVELEECVNCPGGRFGVNTGLIAANTKTGALTQEYCVGCPAGKYLVEVGAVSTDECQDCPQGKYLMTTGSHTEALCKGCPKGRFGALTGLTSINGVGGVCSMLYTSGDTTDPVELTEIACGPTIPCTNGRTCIVKSDSCTGCIAGKYLSDAGKTSADSCVDCPVGRYGEELGADDMIEFCHQCPTGFWSNTVGIFSIHSCIRCPLGRYSSASGISSEQIACLLCAKGYYSDVYPTHDDPVKENECTPCIKGKYLKFAGGEAANNCTMCPVGKYLGIEGSTKVDDCKNCPQGTYLDEQGKTVVHECKPCQAGRKGENVGLVQALDLDFGIGCGECPIGTYQPMPKRPSCARPPAGHFAKSAGLVEVVGCPTGKFSMEARDSCGSCPIGKFNDLERQTSIGACKECPQGTYLNTTGGTSLSDCFKCTAGKYNPDKGGIAESQCQECSVGTYQFKSGEKDCQDCPAGFFSNAQMSINCDKCEAGKYTGVPKKTDCKECPSGYFEVFSIRCNDCPKGYIQKNAGASICSECLPGTYAGAIREISCKDCPKGWAEVERVKCDACPKGFFQDLIANTTCHTCGLGRFAADIAQDRCYDCPAGWQDNIEKTRCDVCGKGFYQPNPKATTCINCEAGKYAPDLSMQYCTSCPAGWQDTDEKNRCDACRKGTYQKLAEQVSCKDCEPGSVSAELSSLTCQNCLAGFYESLRIECKGCKKGEFQALNTDATKCSTCPTGWFTPEERASSCKICPQGWMEAGERQSCTACGKGRYQGAEGGTECKECEDGQYADSERLTKCLDCQVGKWRKDTGTCTHDRNKQCSTTEFCQKLVGDKGTSVCINAEVCQACNEGTYQSLTGQKDCKKCPLGFYQKLKNKDFCSACEMGRFQTSAFVAADKNTREFQDGAEGLTYGLGGLASDCQFCPSGWSNDQINNTKCAMCEIGKYIGCKGGYQCWDCDPGRTSYNPKLDSKMAGTECVAETVITSVPIFVARSHLYGCNTTLRESIPASADIKSSRLWELPTVEQRAEMAAFSQRNKEHLNLVELNIGLDDVVKEDCREKNITSMCITWQMKDAKERSKLKVNANDDDMPYKFTGGFLVQWSIDRSFPPPNEDARDTRLRTNSSLLLHEGALDWVLAENPDATGCNDEDPDPTNDCAPGYFESTDERMHLGPWTYCIETPVPVHMEMLYVRVVGIGPVDPKNGKATLGAQGSPSTSTDTYVTAPTCGDVMYLSQSSYPPDGPGSWTVGNFNPLLENWRCEACPIGGDCRGPKRWIDVYSKYGFSKLDSYDFDNRANAFWPCFKSIACLGGKNANKVTIQWTYYERPPWPSKEEYFLPEPDQDDERLDMPQCCSALNPLVDDVQLCKTEGCGVIQQGDGKMNYVANTCSKRRDRPYKELYGSDAYNCPDEPCPYDWNGDGRWDKGTSYCSVDLAKRDDYEICNEEMGFKLQCNDTTNGRCRLCRACASPDREGQKWFPMGVASCYKCPPKFMNTVGVFLAGGAMFVMVYTFLAAALEDSGAEASAHAEGAHLSQPMQKIILNHAQLVSLASSFPLKWPEEVETMFTYMGMLAQASSYAFNPSCSDSEGGYFPKMPDGKPMPPFYQKSIAMQLMPFIAMFFACVFWTGVAIRDCCDPPQKRHARQLRKRKARAKLQKEKRKIAVHKKAVKLRSKEAARLKKEEEKTLKKKATKGKKSATKVTPTTAVAMSVTEESKNLSATEKEVETKVEAKKDEGKKDGAKPMLVEAKDSTNKIVKEYQSTSGRPKKRKTQADAAPNKVDKTDDPATNSKQQATVDSRDSRVESTLTTTAQPSLPPKRPPKRRKDRSAGSEMPASGEGTSSPTTTSQPTLPPKRKSSNSILSSNAQVPAGNSGIKLGQAEPLKMNQPSLPPKRKKSSTTAGINNSVQQQVAPPTQEKKQETKQETKQEVKEEAKQETKQESKQEVKQDTKQEMKEELALATKEEHSSELLGMLYADGEPEEEEEEAEDPHKLKKMVTMFGGQNYMGKPMHKRQSMRDKITSNMSIKAQIEKGELGKFDKFCATIVTLMYLCYPVLIKSTFQLVACMPIGKNTYLQRDLNVRCWEKDANGKFTGAHFMFVLYLFIPGAVLWVVGMPLITYIVLRSNKTSLYQPRMKFRMGTLYVGYTEACFYWESVISIRKCAVLGASVFLVSFGAETQALAGMMICMVSLIFHLHWKPFIPVTKGRNTLFWAEFWALFVSFLTFWTGLFFFQADKPWWSKSTARGFSIELIGINVMYMILSMRWYMILKLMDVSDLIMTKELQGADSKELKGAVGTQWFLRKFVPEWKMIQNLWAKKAWQSTIRHQIMANRTLRAFGDTQPLGGAGNGSQNGMLSAIRASKSFQTTAQREMHEKAMHALGLGSHISAADEKKKEEKKREEKEKKRARRRSSWSKKKNMFKKSKKIAVVPTTANTEHVKGPMECIEDAARAKHDAEIRASHRKDNMTEVTKVETVAAAKKVDVDSRPTTAKPPRSTNLPAPEVTSPTKISPQKSPATRPAAATITVKVSPSKSKKTSNLPPPGT